MQEGCGGIPLDRPLLLVSNHQTFALDIGPLVEGLLRQTGLLTRGLTHPAVFQVCFASALLHLPPLLLAVYNTCAFWEHCLHSRLAQHRRSLSPCCKIHCAVPTGLHKCFALQRPPFKICPLVSHMSLTLGCAVRYILPFLSAQFGFLVMRERLPQEACSFWWSCLAGQLTRAQRQCRSSEQCVRVSAEHLWVGGGGGPQLLQAHAARRMCAALPWRRPRGDCSAPSAPVTPTHFLPALSVSAVCV